MKKQFKKFLRRIGILGACLASTAVITKAETLVWDRNPEADIAGYKVYYGELNTAPTEINVGNVTSKQFTGLTTGRTYFFYVRAYNTLGLDSDPSGQLNYTVPTGTQNNPPTISTISGVTLAEDATATASFTVGDTETAAGSLVVTAGSSNQSLIPNANLTPGGSGSSRTLAIRPAADQSGSANVTVTVSDGQATASRTFAVTVSAVNDIPVLTDISDRTIQMNSSTGPLAITISDKETAAGSLTLTAQSSNTTLVPQSGLVLGGSGGSRTLNVTPAANQSGQATITVRVSDGVATATDTFLLTVSAATQNTAPTISTIANLTIAEDATGSASFTVSDSQTAAGSLVVTATSSNQSLVPNANLTPGGSGSSRTLAVRPVADQSGTATVTVTVSDGQLSASRTFTVTVSPVNDIPTIADVTDRTITAGTSTGSIPVTISDKETAAGSLTLTAQSSNTTLVPQSGLVLGGSGGSRTLTITPAANQTGEAIITLTVGDGTATATDTFRLTVQSSGSSQTTTIVENFEGPGYENPGWFEIGTPDDDYNTLVIAGSYSLRTRDGERVYRELNSATSASLHLMVMWREWTSAHTLLELGDSAGNPVASLSIANSRIRATHGGASATGTSTISMNVGYHIWIDWEKGSGSNGRMAVYFSSGATKPSTPEALVSTGNGATAQRFYIGGASSSSPSIAFDSVQLSHSNAAGVPATNTAPTISAISDRTVSEDASNTTVSFQVTDRETSAANLGLTATSSDATIIPTSNISFGGSGTNRTITFRPASNRSGASVITVSVSDGQLTVAEGFTVNVTAVNDAPTISNLPDQTVSVNGTTGPIPFTVSDVETSAGSLTVTAQSSNSTLVPASGLVVGGSGSNRTLTVTPAANQSGSATITVRVSDGGVTTVDTFVVTVQPIASPDPSFLVFEDFEGPGYTIPGWFEIGTPDEDYDTVVIDGSFSLRTRDGEQVYRELDSLSKLHLQFMVMWRERIEPHSILDLSDASGEPSGFVWTTSGNLNISHGDITVTAPFSYALNIPYYVWLDWSAGTASNGVLELYISRNSSKPASPLAKIATGNGQPAERIYFGGAAGNSPSIAFDQMYISDGPIPTEP